MGERRTEQKGVDVSMVKTIEGTTAISHIDLIEKERVFGEYEEGVLPKLYLTEEDLSKLADCDVVVSSVWSYAEHYLKKLKNWVLLQPWISLQN